MSLFGTEPRRARLSLFCGGVSSRRTGGCVASIVLALGVACGDDGAGEGATEASGTQGSGDGSTASQSTSTAPTNDASTAPADSSTTGSDDAPPSGSSGTAGDDTGGDSSSTGDGAVPVDPTFSFMIVPDTQNEVLSDNGAEQYFNHRLQWIVDNAEALDVRWVLQTGDLCNWDTPDHDQYERASAGFQILDDAQIPYVIAIGNHDAAATCPGGSACPGDTNELLRDTSTFNSYFPLDRFIALGDVFEADKVDNSFHLIEAGGLDWIIINLELWARTDAYEWMDQVLADHPGHNAIVITHSHLDSNSMIFGSNGGYGDNSPQEIFDEVLSQHANVRFVFSGHTGISGYREDVGANGNTIYQFLYNRIDGVNPVRVVEIDTEADTIDTYVYSPSNDETMDTFGCTVNLTDVEWVR